MSEAIELTVASVKGPTASVLEVLERLGLAGRFAGSSPVAAEQVTTPEQAHAAGANVSGAEEKVKTASAVAPSSVDDELVSELLHQFRRRGFSDWQHGFLRYLAERPNKRITIGQAEQALGLERGHLGGAVGGLGLRLRDLAKKHGVRHKPVQLVLELDRVNGEKAYRFTPEGLAAFQRYTTLGE